MIVIDDEVVRNAQHIANYDNIVTTYFTADESLSFSSPSFDIISMNLFYLLKNSKKITMNRRYRMRPDYLSYDQYGTTLIDQILMYVNGVFLAEEFILQEVYVPSIDSIKEILVYKQSYKNKDTKTVDWRVEI